MENENTNPDNITTDAANHPVSPPQQVITPQSKSNKGIILFLVLVLVLAGTTTFFAYNSLNKATTNFNQSQATTPSANIPNPTTPPTPQTISPKIAGINQLVELLEIAEYSLVDTSKLSASPTHVIKYNFTNGQNRKSNRHNNYTIQFPNSWELYTYTNEEMSDDYGTNIILRKDNNFIRIKQQLYEAGTCYFDKSDESMDMSYLCNLVQELTVPEYSWRVFTVPDSTLLGEGENPWKRYGICDQDAYAKNIASYTTPDEHDKKLCSPWTPVGEIEFFLTSSDQTIFQEFVEIIESIQVQE